MILGVYWCVIITYSVTDRCEIIECLKAFDLTKREDTNLIISSIPVYSK